MTRFGIPPAWRVPIIFGVLCLVAGFAGDAGREWLRWDRSGITEGEIWRLVTGHMVHMSWSHFLLNVVGLVLVWLLVGEQFSPARWLVVIFVTIASIDFGFWFLDPELEWYVGMSGLLHGLLMAGLVIGLQSAPRESMLIAIFVIAKLAFEQLSGPLPGSESASGGAVIVNAHLYGAVSATILALIFLIRVRAKRAI